MSNIETETKEENDIIDILSSDESDDSEEEYSDTETKLDEETIQEDIDSDENISDEDEDEQISGILDIKQQKVFTNNIDNYKFNKLKQKQSLPFLTKFEKSLILGIRLKQLISNGKPMVSTENCYNARDILKKEFTEKKIPLLIRRYLPNNSYEDWKLSELTYSSEF